MRDNAAALEAYFKGKFEPQFADLIDSYLLTTDLLPSRMYRPVEARPLIGLSATQTEMAVHEGKIPAPVRLVEGGRAVAWTGLMLMEFQIGRLIASAQNRAKPAGQAKAGAGAKPSRAKAAA